ncbi:MAG: DUF805 domain-containing protein [Thiotrichaceae bacterium]|nr:DUF805 domain-containing protein [Thiotrichaceae bacterium]
MSDSTNPYAIPQSNIIVDNEDYGEIRLFSSQGRIGRLRYMAYSFSIIYGVFILAAALVFVFPNLLNSSTYRVDAILVIIGLFFLSLMFTPILLTIQRLHDMDRSGWLILLFFIPLLNAALILGLMFIPGNAERNQYGAPPPPNSLLVKIFGALPLIVMIFGMLSSIFYKHGF